MPVAAQKNGPEIPGLYRVTTFDIASVQGVPTRLRLALVRLDLHQLAEGGCHLIIDQLSGFLIEIPLGFRPSTISSIWSQCLSSWGTVRRRDCDS